ncbi:40272_t:CDS:2, partial [Gigaspora margarita]
KEDPGASRQEERAIRKEPINTYMKVKKKNKLKKGETAGMNATLELEDLVVNLIKDFFKDRESMFECCRTSTKMRLVNNIDILTEKEMLDYTCELWIEKVKKFQRIAKQDRKNIEEPNGRTVKVNDINERYETKYEKIAEENDKNEDESANIDNSNSKTIVDNEKKNGIINLWNRRKSDQTKNKNSGNAPSEGSDAETMDNKIIDHLFDPVESVFLKTMVTKLESGVNSYLNDYLPPGTLFIFM